MDNQEIIKQWEAACEVIVKKWQANPLLDSGDIDIKLNNFKILFAYHSGKIENDSINYYDTREIFENGRVSNYTGDLRTLFEQQNQKDCYEFLKPSILMRKPLSIDFIRSIHWELCKGTYDEARFEKGEKPGEFKKHDYVIGYYDAGSDADKVEHDLEELLDEVTQYDGGQILIAATYLHACFEQIHPFADGNGRVGRTLMNYYLMINVHPPLVIFEEDKKEYYAALEAFDRDEDLMQLYRFLQTQLLKTWGKKLK